MTLEKGEISHITDKNIWNENTAILAHCLNSHCTRSGKNTYTIEQYIRVFCGRSTAGYRDVI